MQKLHKKAGLLLVLGCYALALAVWLLLHIGYFTANRICYATGALEYAQLTLDDFELYGLEQQADGSLLTLDSDPRLELTDTGRRVENLVLTVEYERAPRVRSVFWAAPGQDYSLRQMAYPSGGGKDTYLLAPTGGQSLRIDPDSAAGNRITIQNIEINTKRPFYAFFIPSAGEAALFIVLPGLLAAGLYTLRAARIWPGRRGRKAGDAA